MKKIAFFVEGQTEQIFVNKLVKEILGKNRITIITKQLVGGTNVPKQEFVRNASYALNPLYQILIYNCGSDNRVKSEIIENIPNLRSSGYSCIVGLRDLFPLSIDDLPRLQAGLNFLPNNLREEYSKAFDIIIVIQEIETWFLAETNHFRRIDRRLTGPFISKHLGFNPYAMDPLDRKHPSKDLNDIYRLVGRSYTKKYWQVLRLVNKLDFDHYIRHLRYNISSLNNLIAVIESFKKKH